MSYKLIIIDCDGVLYHPSELDINAMVYAFNDVCDDLGLSKEKFTHTGHCTSDKPVQGFCNYIAFIAKKSGITLDEFIKKMVDHINYSKIQPDQNDILKKLNQLEKKYKICICTNNHLIHLDKVLKAKFNISSKDLSFEVFDMCYAYKNGIFYNKESPQFISKLEEHFHIKANEFLWIDDNPEITQKLETYGCQTILVTEENPLSRILEKLIK